MRAVLDTRFFMAGFETEDEKFKQWVKSTLNTCERKTNSGIVPSIVIHELYKLQLSKLGKDVAETKVNAILKSQLQIVNLDPSIAIQAAKLRCKYGELPTAHAIIAATAITTASDCVLTDDSHIKQIRETKTRWF